MKMLLKLKVNGESYEVYIEPWKSLVELLRYELELTGTKAGCLSGDCGTCTVVVDGKAVKSCLILAPQAEGREIQTVEGLAKDGRLHPLQQAFLDHFAFQCGFCTPGMLMTAKALLDENPQPTAQEVKEGIYGTLCRCTGYVKIMEAILAAGAKSNQPEGHDHG
jgi:aerobic carbon-monoxide dehydrogenase small subunit